MDLRFLLLLVCFFVSGFAALLYQTAWTREFAFLFGTSELAVVAVLAAYMGGLALGAAAAARFVGRLARPVLAYGVLELGIAFGALAVPFLIRGVQAAYLSVAGGLDAPPETMALSTALFHLVGSFVVLVPCTALMGATLPLLARYAVSEDSQVGPRIGILYAVNTFGAIAGTLTAAFVLLPALGLRQTVYVGIAGNAVVFLAAAALAKGIAGLAPETDRPETGRGLFHWILPAMLLSGAVSFVYEVLWTRLLGQVLGGSTAAFASMLSSFLLGIALGSAIASRFAKTRSAAVIGFAVSQIGSGLLAWLAFGAVDRLPELMARVGASAATPARGAATAGLLLLPVTLCIGATFPFGVRLLTRDADEAANVSGRVYAWNTVGSIVGSIGAGFFLLPMLGLEGTALVGIATSLLLALWTAIGTTPRRPWLAGLAGLSIAAIAAIGLPRPENLLLHSAIGGGRTEGDLYYLGVGRSATVTVVEHSEGWRILTNGLPESGVERREVPDLRFNETAWLSLLPTAARPDTTDDMLIIGLGGSKTLEATASSVKSVDVIELEEEVVTANRLIPRAVQPLDDPRVHLRLGDARGAMNLSAKSYDAIVSQPSHPWTSGASHLYTRDFFALVHSKLEPGGIFVQWIGMGFVDTALFGSLMAAMSDVFPYVHVYRPVPAALVFMASDQPLDLRETAPRALANAKESFARYGIHSVEDFYASWTLDEEGVKRLAQGRPINTDDHNRLATTRLPSINRQIIRDDFEASLEVAEVLTPERLAQVDAVSVLRRMTLIGEGRRALKLARRLPKAQRLSYQGWMMLDGGATVRAQAMFRRALAEDPSIAAARMGLITSFAGEELPADSLSPTESVLMQANAALRAEDWKAIAALDAELARIEPGTLGFGSAVRARTAWRIEGNDPAEGLAAIGLIDTLLTRERTPDHYFMRAKAGALAGDPAIAWAALNQVVAQVRPRPQLARAALDLAQKLGTPPQGSVLLQQLAPLARGAR